jgi:hypothetical protein
MKTLLLLIDRHTMTEFTTTATLTTSPAASPTTKRLKIKHDGSSLHGDNNPPKDTDTLILQQHHQVENDQKLAATSFSSSATTTTTTTTTHLNERSTSNGNVMDYTFLTGGSWKKNNDGNRKKTTGLYINTKKTTSNVSKECPNSCTLDTTTTTNDTFQPVFTPSLTMETTNANRTNTSFTKQPNDFEKIASATTTFVSDSAGLAISAATATTTTTPSPITIQSISSHVEQICSKEDMTPQWYQEHPWLCMMVADGHTGRECVDALQKNSTLNIFFLSFVYLPITLSSSLQLTQYSLYLLLLLLSLLLFALSLSLSHICSRCYIQRNNTTWYKERYSTMY